MATKRMIVLAGELEEVGYRRISKKLMIVARIDREDWIEVLAKHYDLPFNNMLKKVLEQPGFFEDVYRREFSRDRLYVGKITCRTIPGSVDCTVGYIEKKSDAVPEGASRTPLPPREKKPAEPAQQRAGKQSVRKPVKLKKRRLAYVAEAADSKPVSQFYRDTATQSWKVKQAGSVNVFFDSNYPNGDGEQPASWYSFIEAYRCQRELDLQATGKTDYTDSAEKIKALYDKMISGTEQKKAEKV